MASVDLFGKPIQGNQHSELFKNLTKPLTNPNVVRLTPKQKYDLEKKKIDQLMQQEKYKNELYKLEDARLKLQVAKVRNQIRHPAIIERTNSKIQILKGLFK